MHVLILMWIFVRIRMLDRPADWLRFLNGPRAIALLQIVGDLHSHSGGAPVLGRNTTSARLVPVDGNASKINFHGAHVESAHAVKVLQDTGANGVVVVCCFLHPPASKSASTVRFGASRRDTVQ